MIKHNEKNNIFILETKNTHYVFGVDEEGYNRHIHWGNKCNYGDYEFVHVNGENSNNTVQDEIRQEITPFGSTMYRECDIKAEFADGCREISMHYDSFVLEKNILKVIFKDDYYPLQIILNYEVYDEYDIIKRYVTLKNTGNDNIVFERIFSAQFSLPSVKPYTFINTNDSCKQIPCLTEEVSFMKIAGVRQIIITHHISLHIKMPMKTAVMYILQALLTAVILKSAQAEMCIQSPEFQSE